MDVSEFIPWSLFNVTLSKDQSHGDVSLKFDTRLRFLSNWNNRNTQSLALKSRWTPKGNMESEHLRKYVIRLVFIAFCVQFHLFLFCSSVEVYYIEN